MLSFLVDIDSVFSKTQYEIYKSLFLDSRFGLPGIREYPKGNLGAGDVDSGPVLLGIGGAPSIVGQRTAGKHVDWQLYTGLRNSVEAFGCPYTTGSEKRFIFGQLPMADAFIAWSNSVESVKIAEGSRTEVRWIFHLLSLVIVGVIGYLVIRI